MREGCTSQKITALNLKMSFWDFSHLFMLLMHTPPRICLHFRIHSGFAPTHHPVLVHNSSLDLSERVQPRLLNWGHRSLLRGCCHG